MDRINLFLENLNLREKILFLCFLALFGIFLAFKTYEGFLKDFFSEVTSLDERDLSEKKEEFASLQKDKKSLEKELEIQKEKLEFYENKMQIFRQNSQNYLKELESLSQKYKLEIQNLQSSISDKQYFEKIILTLKLQGDLNSLLNLIGDLENLNYNFHFIEFETSGLSLVLKTELSFIILKNTL